MRCFRKRSVAKKIIHKRRGRVPRLFVEIYLSRKVEEFHRESFSVSLISGIQKVRDKRVGGNQDFPSKLVCLAVAKNFVAKPSCVVFQKISGSGKVHG